MESPSSTPVRATRTRRPRTSKRIITALVAAAAVAAFTPAAPGTALASARTPLAAAPDDTEAQLARLERKAKALSKEYRGELVNLTDARRAAKRAADQAATLNRDLASARTQVARFAARSYMTGGVDRVQLAFSSDPQQVIDDMAVASYLARQNGARVANLETLSTKADTARRTARTKVAEVDKIVTNLERRRSKVKTLLAKFKAEKARKAAKKSAASSSGGVALKAKSPLTGNFMTDRMRRFYLEVDTRFGPFESIGCHRPGDPQDHGTGRACDFMESFGVMPSAARQAHGDRVAQFAIDNASRLGLKYVIWKQRIYDVRDPGWRPMEDRGSITQNHFDHVHISVF